MRWSPGRTHALSIALCCLLCTGRLEAARAQGTLSKATAEFQILLTRLRSLTQHQDSLVALADSATGDARKMRVEQIWERQLEVEATWFALAENLREDSTRPDVSEARRQVSEMAMARWPRYQHMLQGVMSDLDALRHERDAASGPRLLAIESRMSDISDRQSVHHRALVDAILALERAGVSLPEPRQFVITQLISTADLLTTRLRVMERERVGTAAQLARAPDEQGLRHELAALDERRDRGVDNLALAIELLDRLGIDTSRFKVALITTTGKITAHVFDFKVLGGLIQYARKQLLDVLATRAPRWLFRGLIVALILFGFRMLASLTRALVRRALARSQFSRLLSDSLIRLSGNLVMSVGVILALTQLGVQVGALVAGLGIAGFVIGFAMQNTLSNFAAGGMILAERPYDLGDEIEAGSASGKVKAMSLVATTILTSDNQTLIVPNSKIWGDVIRNTTAQSTRRVDLVFSVGYVDDLDKAEKVLNEILASNDKVLKNPPPVVKVHQLADGGVNFVVRPWSEKQHYWDVHWEITRAVKLRFDQEGISIPAARRDLYLHTVTDSDPS